MDRYTSALCLPLAPYRYYGRTRPQLRIPVIAKKQSRISMNSFDIVFSELKKSGMAIDIKRKGDDGVMVDARDYELASLGTKSTVASTAGLLKKLPAHERLEWAIETKNEANAFYKERKFREAMGKYVECLAATDFGTKDDQYSSVTRIGGNVEVLVIPVLCNLAACCIQVEEWSKAISFSEQAIILRPECCKAQLRKGLGLTRIGEHELALACFDIVKNLAIVADLTKQDESSDQDEALIEDPAASLKLLSAADWARLPTLVNQAKRGFYQQKQQLKRQRESLAKAFAKNSTMPSRSSIIESDDEDSDTPIRNTKQEQLALKAKQDKHIVAKPAVKEEVELMSITEIVLYILKLWMEFFVGLFKSKSD